MENIKTPFDSQMESMPSKAETIKDARNTFRTFGI